MESEFECPICLEILADPVTFSCGHSICQDCLNVLLNKCPMCRSEITKMPSKNVVLKSALVKIFGNDYDTKSKRRKALSNYLNSSQYKSLKEKIIRVITNSASKPYNIDDLTLRLKDYDIKELSYILHLMVEKEEIFFSYGIICLNDNNWLKTFVKSVCKKMTEDLTAEIHIYLMCKASLIKDKELEEKIIEHHDKTLCANCINLLPKNICEKYIEEHTSCAEGPF